MTDSAAAGVGVVAAFSAFQSDFLKAQICVFVVFTSFAGNIWRKRRSSRFQAVLLSNFKRSRAIVISSPDSIICRAQGQENNGALSSPLSNRAF
jgi:hypothetical protein